MKQQYILKKFIHSYRLRHSLKHIKKQLYIIKLKSIIKNYNSFSFKLKNNHIKLNKQILANLALNEINIIKKLC